MSDIIQKQDTRRIFVDTLYELAARDKHVFLITCDVGFNYLEKFSDTYPHQFRNFGVTEQSSMVIAAAMGLDGWKVYIYSMIPFVLFRPYEQIRNAVVNQEANVKIIGVKGSEKYKMLGFSHNLMHGDEDIHLCNNIGLEWALPLTNTATVILESYFNPKPMYIRI